MMKRRTRPTYAAVVSTIALVLAALALCLGGAVASGVLVTSKQIKNGTITTKDLHKNAVKGKDLSNGAVGSADIGAGAVQNSDIGANAVTSPDIGDGQVTPADVTMPPPLQIEQAAGTVAPANVGQVFALADVVGTYSKGDSTSALQVDWSGTAEAGFSPCVFQLRVDGKPAASGAGETYVPNGQAANVSPVALFEGLPPGPHQVEVWARIVGGGGSTNPCTVGPAFAGIGQTFVINEQVV